MSILKFVGEIDSSIAIASYRRSIEFYCLPKIAEDKQLALHGVIHPLLSGAAANDFVFDKNVILTGSNASGKSTFIKAVSVNLILAQTIYTCTARNAVIPSCGVITSMAVRDDLTSGESYYIREIRYLKRMADICNKDKLMFLAIDEILRGTNTKERIAASKAILKYLNEKNCILMAATHDSELAYTFDSSFDNYHFCETLENGNIIFDYMLRRGICKTSNAVRLLRVIGFPDEIITDALSDIAE